MRKAVLVTPFHPEIGGGSAHLRKLLTHFENVEVEWLYLGDRNSSVPNTRCIGPNLVGGPLQRDMWRSLKLWFNLPGSGIEHYSRTILATPADVYWIVAMNETIPLGNLMLRHTRKPIHVSVQDDQADGLARRSLRYRWLREPMRRAWLRLLRAASSVDVISTQMEDFYAREYGLSSVTVHPYIPQLPPVPRQTAPRENLRIGHIGNLYSTAEFHQFLSVAGDVARVGRQRPELVLIGGGTLDRQALLSSLGAGATLEDQPSLDEQDAILKLATCDLAYAMYPFAERSTVFRRTSLPTKMSTYLQAQCPVFAHTPPDSTLAHLVQAYSTGIVCESLDPVVIRSAIAKLLDQPPALDCYSTLRAQVYGRENVTVLEQMLLNTVGLSSGS